jgi:hypothetical protein
MGVNYTQHCIIGIKLNLKDLEVVTSPAIYELQNRYDVKTGKINKTENVLVKQKEYHYEFEGKIYKEYYAWEIVEQSGFDGYTDEYRSRTIFLGFKIKAQGHGNVDLIKEELTLDTIKEKFELMQKRFPNHPIKMYFFPDIG